MDTDGSAHELESLRGSDSEDRDGLKSNKKDRESWSGEFEFVLSLVGYAVGLSNIWRFPYLCFKNGGGVFLIPFVIFLCTCGAPLFYMEVCMGQFSGKSPVNVWVIAPLFKGIGIVMATASVLFMWYFGMVFAWVLYYLVQSFYPTLGWATCDNYWNTPQCFSSASGNNTVVGNLSVLNITVNETDPIENVVRTPALEFWLFKVLNKSTGIDDPGSMQIHLVGCLTVGWILVFLCLAKGVKTIGKVVYVTATAPYFLLTVLLIRGVTLDGAWSGLKIYLTPDFSRLAGGQVWIDAAVQVFFSLGPAWGPLITMASFNKFRHNALRDTFIVVGADAFTAIYGGFVVFSVIGFLSKEAGVPIEQMQFSGPGLAFVAYPEALSRLPLPQLWSVLFFVTLAFMGIDTQFGSVETVVNSIIDFNYKDLQKYRLPITTAVLTVVLVCSLPLCLSGGFYLFQLVDWYLATFNLVLTALLECIIIAWIYGANRFCGDIELMRGNRPSVFVRFSWCFIIPVFLLTLLLVSSINYSAPNYGDGGYVFPGWAVAVGNVIAFGPVSVIPIFGLVYLLRQKSGTLKERFIRGLTPGNDWLPHDPVEAEVYTLTPYVYRSDVKARFLDNILGVRC